MAKYIWLKMTKPWGGFGIGDVVRFGEPKGLGRIEAGEGYEVPEPKSEKPIKVETAVLKPKAETAVVKHVVKPVVKPAVPKEKKDKK